MENPWHWGDEQEEAFQRLKRALAEAPVLASPDFSKTFTIHADASQYAIGSVLTQEDENGEHPIGNIQRQQSLNTSGNELFNDR